MGFFKKAAGLFKKANSMDQFVSFFEVFVDGALRSYGCGGEKKEFYKWAGFYPSEKIESQCNKWNINHGESIGFIHSEMCGKDVIDIMIRGYVEHKKGEKNEHNEQVREGIC